MKRPEWDPHSPPCSVERGWRGGTYWAAGRPEPRALPHPFHLADI